jgi:putative Mg2+ transporter-C (MgtC) family protein
VLAEGVARQLPAFVRLGTKGRPGSPFDAGGLITIGPGEGELVGRVAVAAALGAAVGVDRELTDKAAGIRTHALVALGAAAFTVAGYAVLQSPDAVQVRPDLGRIAAQVASGIGFIGAGLIVFQGNRLRGLTTAADLWTVAAIGVLAGFGLLIVATATTGIVVALIVGVRLIERTVIRPRSRRAGRGDDDSS